MSITISEYLSSNPVPDEGWYPALLVDAVDIGTIETPWGPENKLILLFELESEDGNGKRFIVGKRFTRSFSEIAELRNFLENWRGIKYTPSEVKHGVDLENLIGMSASIFVALNENEGRSYAKIDRIKPFKNENGYIDHFALNPSGTYEYDY